MASSVPLSTEKAFSYPSFRLYWVARFMTTFAIQIVSVAVGWQLYDTTRDPFILGLVGLVQFAPALALVLVTGAAADRYNRRVIMTLTTAIVAFCTAAIALLSLTNEFAVVAVLIILTIIGAARAFLAPAIQSLAANLVPPEAFANAIAWNSSSWQIATIVGPVTGGLLYGISPEVSYGTAVVLLSVAAACSMLIARPEQKTVAEPASWTTLLAGFDYVWNQPIVLGAISLDLFAVLLGGATALMPVFARDVLDVGPWGLGMLRAAPAVGALATAAWLMRRPIRDHAGLIMFASVAVFGAGTIVFGASTAAWLSIAALAVMGAADMVSVYIRQTLVQLATPDHLRGRVNAVNMTFIGASNELGEFRAGSMAALIGAVPAVVVGGVATLAVTAIWSVRFPQLRDARTLAGSND